MEPNLLLDFVFVNIVPYLAFFVGVFIAEQIGRYENLARRYLWLTSVPTGLLITSLLIINTTVACKVPGGAPGGAGETITVIQRAYMGSVPEYVLFFAIIIFFGTAAPQWFAYLRTRSNPSARK